MSFTGLQHTILWLSRRPDHPWAGAAVGAQSVFHFQLSLIHFRLLLCWLQRPSHHTTRHYRSLDRLHTQRNGPACGQSHLAPHPRAASSRARVQPVPQAMPRRHKGTGLPAVYHGLPPSQEYREQVGDFDSLTAHRPHDNPAAGISRDAKEAIYRRTLEKNKKGRPGVVYRSPTTYEPAGGTRVAMVGILLKGIAVSARTASGWPPCRLSPSGGAHWPAASGHRVVVPGHSVSTCAHSVGTPTQTVSTATHSVGTFGQTVGSSGHSVGTVGHCVSTGPVH